MKNERNNSSGNNHLIQNLEKNKCDSTRFNESYDNSAVNFNPNFFNGNEMNSAAINMGFQMGKQ